MIEIRDKSNCTGCEACAQICPTQAIALERDSEGFLYPKVNRELCIDCDRCDAVCPVIRTSKARKPLSVHSAYSLDNTLREHSSSGGVFTLLARQILNEGGVVYGAQYNEKFEVEHIAIESEDELERLRGSKYSQSRIHDSFTEVAMHLTQGRKVMFVGTPCQISALRLTLKCDTERLYLVDFICHGVPSPLVWSRYLDEVQTQNNITINHLTHRDKSSGWRRYSVAIEGTKSSGEPYKSVEMFYQNGYIRGFLNDIYLRPSCYKCPTRGFSSGSDITLADYWYIEKIMQDDDKGCSMVLPLTAKGEALFASIECHKSSGKRSMIQRIAYTSPRLKAKRRAFFEAFDRGDETIAQIVARLTATPRYKQITRAIRKFIGV